MYLAALNLGLTFLIFLLPECPVRAPGLGVGVGGNPQPDPSSGARL